MSETTQAVAVENAPAEQPTAWVWNEAKLPEGFPPPGKVGVVMIKKYPAYRAARTSATQAGGESRMFGVLFNHIKQNQIPMTTPVEMNYAPVASGKMEESDMAFMYASPDKPKGTAGAGVEVVDTAPMTVVSIGLRGGYTTGNYEKHFEKLEAFLAANPQWQRAGEPRRLGYNSPFIPWFLRYSEVQIPITAR